MKFAIVQGKRRTAAPRLSGECPVCKSAMTAKCGERKVWHWAHASLRSCDHWWEAETSWHRGWKNQFPEDWQEVAHSSATGEKHIADVKAVSGTVIEFQHSWLRPEERRAREAFYRDMVWVVHANAQDKDKLSKCVARRIGQPSIYLVRLEGCALLRSWRDSGAPVYFDFCDDGQSLWRLSPSKGAELGSIMAIEKKSFVAEYLSGQAVELACNDFVEHTLKVMRSQPPQPLSKFHRYLARTDRNRSRF
jgi:competence protein CoiA